MSVKGEHLEQNFRWGLSELGIVVVVMMDSSMLGSGGHSLSFQLLGYWFCQGSTPFLLHPF